MCLCNNPAGIQLPTQQVLNQATDLASWRSSIEKYLPEEPLQQPDLDQFLIDVYSAQRYKRDTPPHKLESDQQVLLEEIGFLRSRLAISMDPNAYDAATLMLMLDGTECAPGKPPALGILAAMGLPTAAVSERAGVVFFEQRIL